MDDSFVRASEIKPENVTWIWKELIPEAMITVIGGQPDQGKGTMAARIAADVSHHAGVLYSAAEDSHSLMTGPRLQAAGANMDNIQLASDLFVPSDFDRIEELIATKGIKLFVMDPLNAHLSDGVSRHSDSIRRVTGPLKRICEQYRCSVVVIEHALKRVAAGSNPLNALGGSGSGLPAACRMGYLFGVNPDNPDQRLLACVKANIRDKPDAVIFETDLMEIEGLRRPMPSLVEVGELENFDPIRLLTRKTDDDVAIGRPAQKRHAGQAFLEEYLGEHGPTLATEINEAAKLHGFTARTLRRAAADMGLVKDGTGAQCVWSLPELSDSDINSLLDGGEG